MINDGILKNGVRKEEVWKFFKAGEPFKQALEKFKCEVLPRKDLDPTSLLQFGLFMSMAVLNILKESEREFGKKGQQMVINALIRTGYDVGKQIIKDVAIPENIKGIELISFLATIINTQAWTSIEKPEILNDEICCFDILWCPLEDVYQAFDCRVQRYLVQGILNAFRDSGILKSDYQVYFKSTIPAGAKTCKFIIRRKKPGEIDEWEDYSKKLEQRALKNIKK